MSRVTVFILGVATVLASCTALGCGRGGGGGRNDPAATADLTQIGLGYHNYLDRNRKGPANAEEFRPYLGDNPGPYQGLKDGRYVFIWNARLSDNPDTHEVVLAYHKDVPSQGGPVLFMDGSTRNLTADEFKAARIAKARP
jgi:hypothetical protein